MAIHIPMHRRKCVATTSFRSLTENQIQYCVIIPRAFLSLNEISKVKQIGLVIKVGVALKSDL